GDAPLVEQEPHERHGRRLPAPRQLRYECSRAMTNTEEEQDPPENEDENEDAPPEATPPAAPSTWAWLRDCYFSIDRRTLGFARFMVGFFLLMDLGRRTGTWMDMYSSVGV